MAQRIVTAIALVIALLVALFMLPQLWTLAALGLFLLWGAWEWGGFVAGLDRGMRLAYTLAVAIAMGSASFLTAGPDETQHVLTGSVILWMLAIIPLLIYPVRVAAPVVAVAGLLAVVPAWLAVENLLTGREDGSVWLLLLFLIVWAADIGAYFSGTAFGRHKLAPAVSPKKTWEGVIGGLLAAAAVAAAAGIWLEADAAVLVLFALLTAGVSVIGDLTVSLFKRNAGLKDSGSIFPGHGGVLDRIDSLLSAAPLYAIGLRWLGAAP